MLAQRLALKEYRNAQRIFKCALVYVMVVGGAASLILFIGAPYFVMGNSIPVLRVFAPTIFFYGLLGVLRGYFQAHRTMMQTSVSQILEQILNAAVSLGAAYVLMQTAVSAGGDGSTQAMYGAVGSAVGTGAGVVIALLFMAVIYMMNRKMIKRRALPVEQGGQLGKRFLLQPAVGGQDGLEGEQDLVLLGLGEQCLVQYKLIHQPDAAALALLGKYRNTGGGKGFNVPVNGPL